MDTPDLIPLLTIFVLAILSSVDWAGGPRLFRAAISVSTDFMPGV